ncbi:MAG TPA: hypothetical protein VMP89_19585 [Solirubrobacteraceae bacterium]|nr:hypothetical protein [Solirubrobacteraceae bacterium]
MRPARRGALTAIAALPAERRARRKLQLVTPYDDDDDWVGTPPEGRYSRDRAKPEFWWRQRPVSIAAAGLLLVVIIVVVIALTR